MKFFKGILLFLAFLLIGCKGNDEKVIRVDKTVISKVTYDAIKPIFKSKGYKIALRILENVGLIKLNKNVQNPTIIDIIENPKNLQIIDLDQAQTVKALDELDAACVFFTHMSNAKKDPKSYLARDDEMINIPMGVIVKAKNENAKWAIDFANSFKDKSVQDKINAAFPSVFEFYKD